MATNFFNRAFSASSSLSRLASLAFVPRYWASQRCHVDSATSKCRQTASSSRPDAKSLLPSASLPMIWSGVWRRPRKPNATTAIASAEKTPGQIRCPSVGARGAKAAAVVSSTINV